VIPVLGVPVLNRPELLDALLASIDHPVGEIVIIDNGSVVGPDRGRVIVPGHNIGVGASWNLVMKVTPRAPWWLIVNSDIEFDKGQLEKVASAVTDEAGIWMMLGFAAFATNHAAISRTGLFDENYHPAYCEDNDMTWRAKLAGVPLIEVPSSMKHVGSATIYGDLSYRLQNNATYRSNVIYHHRKWGGPMGHEVYTTPFNEGGDIRDTRVDVARLRDQAWHPVG
jgi:GT2 family glycosyltransferase